MRAAILILAMTVAAPAFAAPPPPPPVAIMEAARSLSSPAGLNSSTLPNLLAPDVQVVVNGKVAASSKEEWLTLQKQGLFHDNGKILGVSEASDSVLLLDTFDTVGREHLPPNAVFDARMASRATFYQFGPDHLIHLVNISRTDGFWTQKAF